MVVDLPESTWPQMTTDMCCFSVILKESFLGTASGRRVNSQRGVARGARLKLSKARLVAYAIKCDVQWRGQQHAQGLVRFIA